jgi:hypothetical protein
MERLTTRRSRLPESDVVCAALTKMTTTSFSGPCHDLSGDHQTTRTVGSVDLKLARSLPRNASIHPCSRADTRGASVE